MPSVDIELLGEKTPALEPQSMDIDIFDKYTRTAVPPPSIPPPKPGALSRAEIGFERGIARTIMTGDKALIWFGEYISNNQTTVFGTPALVNTKPLGQRLIVTGRKLLEKDQAAFQKRFPDQERDFVTDLGEGVVSLGLALGAGVAFGAAVPGIAFGAMAKFETFEEAQLKGKDFKEAERISDMHGFVEGGLEFIGVSRFLKAGGGLVKRAIRSAVVEFAQEFSQSVGEGIIKTATGLRDFKGKETVINIISDAAYEGAIGAVLGGAASVPVSAAQYRATEDGFKEMGASPRQAKDMADQVMREGMDRSLEVVENIAEVSEKDHSRIIEGIEPARRPGEIVRDEAGKPIKVGPVVEARTVAEVDVAIDTRLREEIEKAEVTEEKRLEELPEEQLKLETINNLIKDIKEGDKFDEQKLVLDQLNERKQEIQERITELKPQFVRRQEATVLKEKIANIQRGFRQGKVQSRKEIKAVQTEILNILKQSGLDQKDKAKFNATIKNTQTAAQLEKILPKIEQRIIELQEKAEVKDVRGRIQKLLKRSKVRKQAGKPKGKLGPDVQKIFDRIKDITVLTKEQAGERVLQNIKDAGENIPTADVALENRLLFLFSGLEKRPSTELTVALNELEALFSTGRAISELAKMEKVARNKEVIEDSKESIIGDKPADPSRIKNNIKEFGKTLRRTGLSLSGWDDVMDFLSQNDITTKPGESKLSKLTGVTRIEQKEKGAIRVSSERMVKIGMEAFNLDSEKALLKQLRGDEEIKVIGQFTNIRGELANLELSKAEARKIWMELKDPSLVKTLTSKEGNAYSQDMIDRINEFLSAEDIAFAKGQLDFYQGFYNRVNKVYRRIYGVDLPFNEFYSPISREVEKTLVADEFLKEQGFRQSIAPGGLKSRVENIRPIKVQSDVDVIQRHIIEMEHFMAWADKIQDLNTIFSDNSVKKLIERKYGAPVNSVINGFIQDFTRGGIERSRSYQNIIDTLRINFTVSALAIKPALTVKQMVSFIAFAEFIPTANFISGVLDLATDTQKKLDLLSESELMKGRGKTITRDIRDGLQSNEFRLFKQSNSFRNAMLFTTRLGDRGAIVLGGWSVYKYNREVLKKSHEDSLAAFEDATSATQQSSDLSQLSEYQRGPALAKLFTMFTSAQNQYFRRVMSATRNVATGRITKQDFAKKMFIYHFMLPILFQFVAAAGRWDEDEMTVTGILGSFNGIFILGDIMDTLLRTSLVEFTDAELDVFDPGIPPLETYRGIKRSMGTFSEAITLEEYLEGIGELAAGTVGPITGLPAKQILDFYEGGTDLVEGDLKSGSLKLMGWSPYIVNKLEE